MKLEKERTKFENSFIPGYIIWNCFQTEGRVIKRHLRTELCEQIYEFIKVNSAKIESDDSQPTFMRGTFLRKNAMSLKVITPVRTTKQAEQNENQ